MRDSSFKSWFSVVLVVGDLTPSVTIMMRYGVFVLYVFSVSAAATEHHAARARHRQEWVTWSNKTGLPINAIERFWRTTMGSDDEASFGDGIEMVDAASLRTRKQTLFVTTGGNGHCLHLYIFGNSGSDNKPLWELSGLPNGAGGICHEQLLPYPTAYARSTGDIVVQVPTAAAWVKEERVGDYPVSTALMGLHVSMDWRNLQAGDNREDRDLRLQKLQPEEMYDG